jgi:two-component system, response regulator YesN
MIDAIIVDDEYLIREGLMIMIDWEALGVNVISLAANGQEALEIIQSKHPQLAIVDIKMPVLDGIELIKTIKQSGSNTVFIILSGYDNFSYAQEAIKLGAFRYLLKPVEDIELAECVKEATKFIKIRNKEEGIVNKFKSILGEKLFEGVDSCEDNTLKVNGREIKNNSLIKLLQYINEHLTEDITLDELSKVAFMHPSYLSQTFKNEIGENYIDYITRLRIERAKEFLKTGNVKSYEVAEKVGYNDARYFSQVFKKHTGYSPSEFKKLEGAC